MLNVDLAFRKLAMLVTPVGDVEEVALGDAVGRISAVDIVAPIDLPPFDSSAMDGYAVNASAATGTTVFEVIDTSLAGRPAKKDLSRPGTAIRIFTGAVMPLGADTVVLQEDVTIEDGRARISETIRIDQNVRHRGQDVRKGELLCPAGTRFNAYRLGWLAACGMEAVGVTRRVRVAVFSTGDELAQPGTSLAEGQIYDSNRLAILTLLREKAVEPIDMGCLPDDAGTIRSALVDASATADIVVTSGGVSVGAADLVKNVVEEIGSIDFWKIALKPGKPLAVGTLRSSLFFGLPGNPVSSIVTYLLFVSPAIDLMGGENPAPPMMLPAVVEGPIRHTVGRREYVRGRVRTDGERLVVSATGDQSSNRLATFADANCLVVVSETAGDLRPGDRVDVILLPGEAHHPMRRPLPANNP